MGVFFTSNQSAVPAITTAIKDALMVSPNTVSSPEREAVDRAATVIRSATPQFQVWRFLGAVVICAVLLALAIWTKGKGKDYDDISTTLLTSFTAFSGLVLGLLGGEAQKSV
jgi:hypothetical protein